MKRMLGLVSVVTATVLGTAFLAAILLFSGCDTGGDTVSLTVDPSFVDLSVNTNGVEVSSNAITQTFSVTGGLRELSFPLTWTVSNPDLGSIASSGGASASYVRNEGANGDNAIHVTDQYGAEGVATVRQ